MLKLQNYPLEQGREIRKSENRDFKFNSIKCFWKRCVLNTVIGLAFWMGIIIRFHQRGTVKEMVLESDLSSLTNHTNLKILHTKVLNIDNKNKNYINSY